MKNKPNFNFFSIFNQKKADMAINTPLKVLISVILGALMLTGLTFLVKDLIMPNIDSRTTSMFQSDIEYSDNIDSNIVS